MSAVWIAFDWILTSRPTETVPSPPSCAAKVCPSLSTKPGVRKSAAGPRIPEVPKSLFGGTARMTLHPTSSAVIASVNYACDLLIVEESFHILRRVSGGDWHRIRDNS